MQIIRVRLWDKRINESEDMVKKRITVGVSSHTGEPESKTFSFRVSIQNLVNLR